MPLFNTQADFIAFLKRMNASNTPGQAIFGTVTEVIMRRRGNPYVGALKVQVVEVKWNVDYEERVNLFRAIESKPEDFVAEDLKWGQCDDNIVVTHGGRTYIKTIELCKAAQPIYMHDGREISYSDLEPYIRVPARENPKQNLNKPVRVRTFHIDNIISCLIGDTIVYEKPAEIV